MNRDPKKKKLQGSSLLTPETVQGCFGRNDEIEGVNHLRVNHEGTWSPPSQDREKILHDGSLGRLVLRTD